MGRGYARDQQLGTGSQVQTAAGAPLRLLGLLVKEPLSPAAVEGREGGESWGLEW